MARGCEFLGTEVAILGVGMRSHARVADHIQDLGERGLDAEEAAA